MESIWFSPCGAVGASTAVSGRSDVHPGGGAARADLYGAGEEDRQPVYNIALSDYLHPPESASSLKTPGSITGWSISPLSDSVWSAPGNPCALDAA